MEKNLFKYLLCVFIERAAPPPPEFDVCMTGLTPQKTTNIPAHGHL